MAPITAITSSENPLKTPISIGTILLPVIMTIGNAMTVPLGIS